MGWLQIFLRGFGIFFDNEFCFKENKKKCFLCRNNRVGYLLDPSLISSSPLNFPGVSFRGFFSATLFPKFVPLKREGDIKKMKNIYYRVVPEIVRFVSTLERPRWFVKTLNKWFARHYNIDIFIATKPLHDYNSLLDFFLRELKPNTRPVDSDDSSIISPVDAKISAIGKIEDDTILLVKGNPNSISDLVEDNFEDYKNGEFIMLYLSPADCHRIYSPVTGRLIRSKFIEGKVYPVFEQAVEKRPDTFVVNKRVVTELESSHGKILMVKVGALNVGQIPVNHPLPFSPDTEFIYEKGSEIGRFEFGSTVILLFESGKFKIDESLSVGCHVKIGEKIGEKFLISNLSN